MRIAIATTIATIALVAGLGCSRAKPDSAASNPNALVEITISSESQQAAGITVAPATVRSMPVFIRAVGAVTVNEQKTDHIGVVFPGTITKVLANVGDRVRAGQALAIMHSHDMHDAVAAYQSALAETAYAQTVRDRYAKLYKIQYASREEAERSELQYQKAFASLTAARSHLAGMLQVPERGLDGLDIDADAMPIKAPHDGVVMARMVTPGMALQPGSETFTVSDLSSLWMIASVSEPDIHAAQVGRSAVVRVRAYPNAAFPGRIDQLAPRLDPSTRTLSVRVVVANGDGRLRPDMFGTAELAEGASRNAVFVPEVAVQDMNGNSVVFVRHGNTTFEARPVQLGTRLDGMVELKAGVTRGEAVATDGAFVVKSQFLIRALSQE